jgi:heptaprenylglyceryl phosphate synthase
MSETWVSCSRSTAMLLMFSVLNSSDLSFIMDAPVMGWCHYIVACPAGKAAYSFI